jgi:hypothetical protein
LELAVEPEVHVDHGDALQLPQLPEERHLPPPKVGQDPRG